MSLTKWEIKKVWKRRSARIALALAIIYTIFVGCFNGMHNLGKTNYLQEINGYGDRIPGTVMIKQNHIWADKWRGELTEEKLIEAKHQIEIANLPENETTFEDGSTGISNEAYEKYITSLGNVEDVITETFALLPEYASYYDSFNIPMELVGDYYNQRDIIINDYMTSQVLDEGDRQFFIEQNQKVKKPFYYDWVEGQNMYLSIFPATYLLIGFLLAVALAPVFAGEFQNRASNILLSSKLGRRKLANAKVKTALIYTVGTYFLCSGIYFACQLGFVGTRGLRCPIQIIKPIATAPLYVWQVVLFSFVLGLFAVIAITAIAIILSSVMSSAFPVIIITVFIVYIPNIMADMMPEAIQNIISVLPMSSDYTELFRPNMYHIFGISIWSPYVIIASMVIIGAVCLWISRVLYYRREA